MKQTDKKPQTKPSYLTETDFPATTPVAENHLFSYLSLRLADLEYIEQSPRYHPEGNVLFHSLQVYQLAKRATNDPELWAAALLHDIGKSVATREHAIHGSEMLQGLLSPRICWLVEHHLHLLTVPKRTRKRLWGTKALLELEQLRRWDIGGRIPECTVTSADEALAAILPHHTIITSPVSDDIYSQSIPYNHH